MGSKYISGEWGERGIMDKRMEIQALLMKHIPFAMELKNLAGWNQTEEDWESYLQLEHQGCFLAKVIESEGEEQAGTAVALSYEDKIGWIGMVLVHPSQRKLGIGTALLKKSIQYLHDHHIRCIKLDATPMGKKVYEPLGFVDEYEVSRYQTTVVEVGSKGSQLNSLDIKLINSEHLDLIADWDANIFGAKRSKVLEGFLRRKPELCFCYITDNQIKGYVMAHEGNEAYQIGPFLAQDAGVAEALFSKVMKQLIGHKVFIDVPLPNHAAVELVRKSQFTIQRSFCRMYLGQNQSPGQPHKVYGTSGAEKG